MLTYRGDKFIKGKKFIIGESTYRFQKRDNSDNLIFESIGGKKLKLTEAEFNSKSNKSEDDMIKTLKAYFEDNNEVARQEAYDIISKYAISDEYPNLQAYIKELLGKNLGNGNSNNYKIGSLEHTIQNVANEFGVDFNNKVPFENFYAPDSDGESEDETWYSSDYDYADFYDKILHDLGYGENPVLNDLKAEVHEVSDGKYTMTLFNNGEEYTLDIKASEGIDSVKDNVNSIIEILSKNGIKESLSFEEESDKIIDFDEAVRGYIEFELGMDDMDPDTAKYLNSLNDEDIKKIARKVLNQVDSELNEIINEYLYSYKSEKMD